MPCYFFTKSKRGGGGRIRAEGCHHIQNNLRKCVVSSHKVIFSSQQIFTIPMLNDICLLPLK